MLIFGSYLNDETATKDAFDEEGFFKTGDLVRRVGACYFFEGRGDSDCTNPPPAEACRGRFET
jgi:malonyl-CoA/methylmalonyl-CoA synthetase